MWTLAALLAACVVRIQSLGAWIAFGVSAVVLAMGRRTTRKAALLLGLLALPAIGIWIRSDGFSSWPGFQDRIYMWQAAWEMVKDRPLIGHGVNTFMSRYLDYWVGGEQQPRYAHNCYLQVWAETGLLGLGTLLWLFSKMGSAWIAGLRNVQQIPHRWLLLGMVAALAAFATQSAVDTNFYALRQATLFWALAGLATGLAVSKQVGPTPCATS